MTLVVWNGRVVADARRRGRRTANDDAKLSNTPRTAAMLHSHSMLTTAPDSRLVPDRPIVSVIVPAFRRPERLPRALASVRSQTYRGWEAIVVDDNGRGTPDQVRTARCMEAYAGDERITYLVLDEHRGASAARNVGIRHGRGELLAFLDDDDEWLPDKLTVQVAALRDAPEGTAAVVTSLVSVDHRTGRTHVLRARIEGDLVGRLLESNVLNTASTLLCRRGALEQVGMFDVDLHARNDVDVYVRLAQRYGFVAIERPLVRFHQHTGPRISRDREGKITAQETFLAKHAKLFDRYPSIHHRVLKVLARRHLARSRPGRARELFVQALRIKPYDVALFAWLTYGSLPTSVRNVTRDVLAGLFRSGPATDPGRARGRAVRYVPPPFDASSL